ncbi:hypothetical protein RCL1_002952 [Eukaryota sp. TZLM3-RCL]
MVSNNYFAESQKGFVPGVSGCIKHQFLLKHSIDKCRSIGKYQVCLAMTDFGNAFGPVRHSLIEFALSNYDFPPRFIELISSMYDELKNHLLLNEEMVEIDQKIGVCQGDVLSLCLLLMVMNLILEPIHNKKLVAENGVTLFKNVRTTCIAFAEDVSILGRSTRSLQTLLSVFQRGVDWTKCLCAAKEN